MIEDTDNQEKIESQTRDLARQNQLTAQILLSTMLNKHFRDDQTIVTPGQSLCSCFRDLAKTSLMCSEVARSIESRTYDNVQPENWGWPAEAQIQPMTEQERLEKMKESCPEVLAGTPQDCCQN